MAIKNNTVCIYFTPGPTIKRLIAIVTEHKARYKEATGKNLSLSKLCMYLIRDALSRGDNKLIVDEMIDLLK